MTARDSRLACLVFLAACARPPVAAAPSPTAAVAPAAMGFHDGERVLGSVHDEADARRLCDASLRLLGGRLDALGRLAHDGEDGAVIDALLALDATARVALNTSYLFSRTSGSHEVRLAASECGTRIDALDTRVPRGEILDRLARLHGRDAEESRYLANVLDEAHRGGSALRSDDATRLAALVAHADETRARMSEALGRSSRSMRVESARLRGAPASFLATHAPDGAGLVTLTTDSGDVNPVLRFVDDRTLAHELFKQAKNRAYPENEASLHDLLATRHAMASVLGYSSWADEQAASRMVGTRARTVGFLDQMKSILAPVNARYRAALRLPSRATAPLESDAPYLEDHLARERYGVDAARAGEYFEAGHTLRAMLLAVGEAYGFRFEETHVPTWSEDVVVFDVRRDDGVVAGRFYFDLYARPGKATNAGTTVPLVPRALGSTAPAEVAVLMNIAAPTASSPSLLTPEQLAVLLHETGHALHYLLTPGGSALFEREFDFFDAPSQVMEAFATQPAFLTRVGRHYQTGAALPASMVNGLVAQRSFRTWQNLRTFVLLGDVDVRYHGADPPSDTTRAYLEAFEQVEPYAYDPDTHPDASLFLPTLAYDGNGHALAWGLAIAADIIGHFEERGFFDRATWRAYIDEVLSQDGPAEARLTKFLGRPWNDARLRAQLDRVFAD
jgi:thimet oligopeptidase